MLLGCFILSVNNTYEYCQYLREIIQYNWKIVCYFNCHELLTTCRLYVAAIKLIKLSLIYLKVNG